MRHRTTLAVMDERPAPRMDWLGLFLPRVALRRPPPLDLDPPNGDDVERIEELRALGSKLKLPHPVRAFLCFATEASARQAAGRLHREGFTCQLRNEDSARWRVTAVTRLVPSLPLMTRMRKQLESVAADLEGTYEGWDAPAVY